jgi:tellurite resistance protein TehA-like permease
MHPAAAGFAERPPINRVVDVAEDKLEQESIKIGHAFMKRWAAAIGNIARNFHPAYFAMVMATGIMSIAFDAMAFTGISQALFRLNLVFYPILCILLVARVLLFRPNLTADLKTLHRSWLFLTFVVGTNTFGMQLIIFQRATDAACALWLIALAGWFICIYFIFFNLIPLRKKPAYEIVNGAALLIIVSTVSMALLGLRLLDATAMQSGHAYIAAWAFWAIGFLMYLLIVPIVIYRLFFIRLKPVEWEAPYWICMGAPAIITLTGSEFVLYMPRMPDTPQLENIREMTFSLSILAWIIGTSWIPYQLIMDIRQFIRINIMDSPPLWIKAFPWSRLAFGRRYHFYGPPSWSRVFPMGMYTACTLALAKITGFGFLGPTSHYWGWFALLIWFLTLIGMLRSVLSGQIS